jgi:hypothetical protein
MSNTPFWKQTGTQRDTQSHKTPVNPEDLKLQIPSERLPYTLIMMESCSTRTFPKQCGHEMAGKGIAQSKYQVILKKF